MKTEEDILNKAKSIVDNRFNCLNDRETQRYYDGWLECMEWILEVKDEEKWFS